MLAAYSTAKAQKMMMQLMARLRSRNTRKLTIGLSMRVSRKIRKPNPSVNTIISVCTRQNGSLTQSHSCPLLSMISQLAMTSESNPRPMPSKLTACGPVPPAPA